MFYHKCGPSFLSLIAELIFFRLCAGWRRSCNTKQGSSAPARSPRGFSLNPEDTELAAVIAVPLVGSLLLRSFSPEKPGDPLQSATPPTGPLPLDCQQPPVSTVHMDITMILQF